jgi:2-polyprenyl-3-methyl-5-hydroxy-6-metoxy-1,4-benzoquinol methylase
MIISKENINILPKEFLLIGGAYDPIHEGHIEYFKYVSKYGLPGVLSLDPDEYVESKHTKLLPQAARAVVLNSIKYIDYVYINSDTTAEALALLKPTIFIKGKDWEGKLPVEEIDFCRANNIKIEYLDTKLNSSSKYLIGYNKNLNEKSLEKFELLYRDQKMPSADMYDIEYYQGEWRTEDAYTLASRRAKEGRNPELIKNILKPKKVLDVGCGPGFLMQMLFELGIDVYGVDHSLDSLALAPENVKSRITIADICNYNNNSTYDLIICREVVEHMPVRDVFNIISKMCSISSKYVYLTTRFNNSSKSILDVTTEYEVDPTHITIMDIYLVRLFFVLNKMKRRKDLEAKMDWLNKGRVLIYEKI